MEIVMENTEVPEPIIWKDRAGNTIAFAVIWSTDDVINTVCVHCGRYTVDCEGLEEHCKDWQLSPETIGKVLDKVNESHDAETGINWECINDAMREVLDGE